MHDSRLRVLPAVIPVPDARPFGARPTEHPHPLGGRGALQPRSAAGATDYADVGRVVGRSRLEVDGETWERLMVRTHVIRPGEEVSKVLQQYAGPVVQPQDWVIIGQKAVSIAQGRLVRERLVRPRPLAVFLARHVKRTPFGRGLGRPATMEVAIREAGVPRILAACAAHLVGRALNRSGDFYRVAGQKVASIDGVTEWALPPFNEYIVLHPVGADALARRAAARLGTPVAIVDLNDLGGEILGASAGIDRPLLRRVLADNPLGQGPFCTPLAVVRRAAPAGQDGSEAQDPQRHSGPSGTAAGPERRGR